MQSSIPFFCNFFTKKVILLPIIVCAITVCIATNSFNKMSRFVGQFYAFCLFENVKEKISKKKLQNFWTSLLVYVFYFTLFYKRFPSGSSILHKLEAKPRGVLYMCAGVFFEWKRVSFNVKKGDCSVVNCAVTVAFYSCTAFRIRSNGVIFGIILSIF